jgi:hypothetical protein
VFSGSTVAVRSTGRRSGQHFTLPVQYARQGADLIILAGRPQTLAWWRNFDSRGVPLSAVRLGPPA